MIFKYEVLADAFSFCLPLPAAYEGIEGMLYGLGIDGGDSIARPALSFYTVWFIMLGSYLY